MRIAFVVRDELLPVRNGYHSTGVNLLRQLVKRASVRCVHLATSPATGGETAAWCADHGIGYEVVTPPALTAIEGASGAGVLSTLARALRPSARRAVADSLRRIGVGEDGERIVMFTTGWDALGDVVADLGRAVCLPADSITLFEQRRRVRGIRRLFRPARVAVAAARERAMLHAGFRRVIYVTETDAQVGRSLLRLADRSLVVTVPIGINPEEFGAAPSMAARLAGHGVLLVFTGTLAFLPNRDAAERLATQILPRLRDPSVRVRLVGGGGELLSGLAGPRLEIAGWVPSLIAELQRSTLFVAPVRMGAGAKNNVLQALAAGTPVLATSSCFAGFDKVPPGAITCESDDDFVQTIERLVADAELLNDLSNDARTYALTRCTWSASADRLHAHLEDGT